MSHFLLGMEIIFPIFVLLLIGFFARKKGLLDGHFVNQATWLVFHVALPLKLFTDIRKAEIDAVYPIYILYILLGILLVFSVSWALGRPMIRDPKKLSVFIHCAFRSNFVYVGFPILDALYDKPSTEHIVIILVFGLTLYNLLAIFILTYYAEEDKKRVDLLEILLKVLKNPMILATLLGVAFNFLNLPVYSGLDRAMGLLSQLSTPLSLLLIGASLNFSSLRGDLPLILSSAAIRTILAPLVLIPIGLLIGLSPEGLGVAYVFWATPCAINCFIYSKEMGADAGLASKIITASFLFSIVTYPIGIGLLDYFQII